MVRFMTGTPGSGKTYSMSHLIQKLLRDGVNVICTVNIKLETVTKKGKLKIGDFQYIPIYELTPETLERYALINHVKGKESQTYVFIDECQLIFNSRDYAKAGRRDWLVFFTSHRHYGYELYLITQHDEMVDKQIRAVIEHEIKYLKLNNYLWWLNPFATIFKATETWYGSSTNLVIRREYIRFRRNVAQMYNSFALFDDLEKKYPDIHNKADAAYADASPNGESENEPPTNELLSTPKAEPDQPGQTAPTEEGQAGRVGLFGYLRKLFA